MLKALSRTALSPSTASIPICTPLTFFYIPSSQIQIIQDLQPATDLASIITSSANVSPPPDFAGVGFALGTWLRAFHSWTKEPAQFELRGVMEGNGTSRELKRRTTYDTITDIAQNFSMIRGEDLFALREVRARVLQEYEQELHADADRKDGEQYGLIHGDFWTGK